MQWVVEVEAEQGVVPVKVALVVVDLAAEVAVRVVDVAAVVVVEVTQERRAVAE